MFPLKHKLATRHPFTKPTLTCTFDTLPHKQMFETVYTQVFDPVNTSRRSLHCVYNPN